MPTDALDPPPQTTRTPRWSFRRRRTKVRRSLSDTWRDKSSSWCALRVPRLVATAAQRRSCPKGRRSAVTPAVPRPLRWPFSLRTKWRNSRTKWRGDWNRGVYVLASIWIPSEIAALGCAVSGLRCSPPGLRCAILARGSDLAFTSPRSSHFAGNSEST